MDQIVTESPRIGETNYLPGDKIEVAPLLKLGLLNEGVVAVMTRNQAIVEATAETMAVALARRPGGSPWPPRGFTEAYMESKGWIAPKPPAAAKKAAPKAEEPAPPKVKAKTKPAAEKVDTAVLTDEKIAVGPNFLQPVNRGKHFIFWQAVAPDGRVLRDRLFRAKQDGLDWLEALSTSTSQPDTPAKEAEPPAAPQESQDDVQLRSESGQSEGSGSPEDR